MVQIKITDNALHFYFQNSQIEKTYLGMLTKKGEISDFRAIIRKKNIYFNNDIESFTKKIKYTLHTLFNFYMDEQTEETISNRFQYKEKEIKESSNSLLENFKIVKDKWKEEY